MIKYNLRFLLFYAVIMLLISCNSKGPKEAKYIPKDASFVIAVDAGSLQDKMKTGNIDIDSLFKQAIGNDSLKMKNKQKLEFEKFKNAGIDWSGKFFVFMTQKTDASKGQGNFFNLLGSLKDSAKLLTYLESIDEFQGRDVKKGNGYSYIQLDYHGIISWTDKNVIATFYHYTEGQGHYMDSTPTPAINKSEEILKEVTRYYSQNENESIKSVVPFVEMFKEKADGYFLSSTNGVQNALSKMPIQLPKLEELLKDNYSTGTFNFDKGKIVATSHFYPNNLLGALLKKYSGRTVNTSMIENYPSNNMDMAMLVSFNPDIFGGLLQQLEVESLADGFLEKVGITSKDLYKCLNGDIAFMVSDFSLPKNSPSAASPFLKPSVKMIFNATIGDMSSFNKLMGKAVESGFVSKTQNGYQSGALMSSMGFFLHTDNKNLIFASDSLTYLQYVTKTGKAAINSEVMDQLKGKSSATYIDLDHIIGGFYPADTFAGNQTLRTIKATFKDIIATADNFDGKTISGKMEMRLKDEKQNSLVTLMKLIPMVAEQIKKSRATALSDSNNESILSLPFLSKINNL
jgi:hypothetical protein